MRYINKIDLYVIARNCGALMVGIGLMCLVPIRIDMSYQELNAVGFLIPAAISIIVGLIFTRAFNKYSDYTLRLKHGMIISAVSWLWASLIGGLIFYMVTGISIVDAIFESMSALTGSGITIYPDVEILPHSILFFRAFQQWIGGLGIIVMIVAFLSKPGSASYKLYQSEAREERLKPSTANTLIQTITIYIIYTLAGIFLYILAGMPIFDSICNTFCIISTGGMSVKNANIGFYHSDIINLITIILMILGATSFLVHFKIIKSKGKSLINDLQFKVLISIIAGVSLLIYFASSLLPMDILFHVVSAITTTGASIQSSTVMGGWPSSILIIIMVLMIIGGSSGSTVGAIKLIRVITFFKGIYRNLRDIMSPEGSVFHVNVSGKKIEDKIVAASGNYIALYLLFIVFTWIVMCSFGHDTFHSLFYTISLQGNIGLEIGQMSQSIQPPLKILGIFNMWLGRLEIFPVLVSLKALFEVFKSSYFKRLRR